MKTWLLSRGHRDLKTANRRPRDDCTGSCSSMRMVRECRIVHQVSRRHHHLRNTTLSLGHGHLGGLTATAVAAAEGAAAEAKSEEDGAEAAAATTESTTEGGGADTEGGAADTEGATAAEATAEGDSEAATE